MTSVVVLAISHAMGGAQPLEFRLQAHASATASPTTIPLSYPRAVADVALFLHLLGAVLFTAGIVLASAAFEYARRREQAAEIATLLGLTRVGVALVAAGSLLILGFGLWLVHLEYLSYSTGWVSAAILLYLAALTLGALGGQKPSARAVLPPNSPLKTPPRPLSFTTC